jgi:hypothetical protein
MLNGSPPFENTSLCPFFRLVSDGDWQQFWNNHEHHSQRVLTENAKAMFARLLGPTAAHRPLISELAAEIDMCETP